MLCAGNARNGGGGVNRIEDIKAKLEAIRVLMQRIREAHNNDAPEHRMAYALGNAQSHAIVADRLAAFALETLAEIEKSA
jgi:hypothetical protein